MINVEKMSEIKIDKKRIYKQEIKVKLASGKKKVYTQYRIILPKEFAEAHANEDVYVIADSVGLIVRDEETLMKILEKFPDLRKFVLKQQKHRKKRK